LLQKTIAQFNIEHSNHIDQTIAISNSSQFNNMPPIPG
jgi:hypothetical protein